MNLSISLPYHFIIPTIISVFVLIAVLYQRKRLFTSIDQKWLWTSLTVFLIVYILIIGGAWYTTINSQLALEKFDLNQDGFFTANEITVAQKEALEKVTRDTGRSFSFLTGLFVAGVVGCIVFVFGKFIVFIKTKK
ncbi:hypothetical protein [Flavobacterium sp. PL002]|uniref:hypothetical protein n=1 Tax=Flavobacterium sp. PL002 TaxID=1897058 RepID=UPI00178876A6|nr:hypothetical protein [Flavobacterium sp. PL002]MBE0393363.1 hypothetical protein [Flavobacterium sp. PL002]